MKKVAVIQSNYIPWKGYFDIIHDADLFIFHDDLQYTKNDWRNRNKIKTPKGAEWLTIPVGSHEDKLICEIELKDPSWQKKHWRILQQHYGKAPFFEEYKAFFQDMYLNRQWRFLSELNQYLIVTLSKEYLGMETRFTDSAAYHLQAHKLERLLELLGKAEADVYISGPAAKDYIDERAFGESGIQLVWKDYSGYPEYPQFYPPFTHQVTVLDLLFQTGPAARDYIWGWREKRR
jgi:hypothetical protein